MIIDFYFAAGADVCPRINEQDREKSPILFVKKEFFPAPLPTPRGKPDHEARGAPSRRAAAAGRIFDQMRSAYDLRSSPYGSGKIAVAVGSPIPEGE